MRRLQDLSIEVSDSMATGKGVFVESSTNRKPHQSKSLSEAEKTQAAKRLETSVASIVSKALTVRLHIDAGVDSAIPEMEKLVAFLDESRLGSLRAKSEERVLLANLLSRTTNMTEPFANAYTGSIVRAGEAVGHSKLFESVQDEPLKVSTMLPYDIFTDERDQWEDPCRSNSTQELTGEDLFRRCHARGVIHKALRKLQDRQGVRGGVQEYGPYADVVHNKDQSQNKGAETKHRSAAGRPRVGQKRRHSLAHECPIYAGTGFGAAYSWAVYEPNVLSVPLERSSLRVENTPYGVHRLGARIRSLSLSLSARSGEPRNSKKAKRAMSIPEVPTASTVGLNVDPDGKLPRSTVEINWGQVAGIFQKAETPRRSPSSRNISSEATILATAAASSRTIVAPFCEPMDPANLPDDDSVSGEEEVLPEETLLSNHQVILDQMKEKINAFLESQKKQQQDRRKHHRHHNTHHR